MLMPEKIIQNAADQVPSGGFRVPQNRELQFSHFGLLTVLVVVIMFGFLLRVQSVSNAQTDESLARLSSFVHQMAVRQREDTVRRASAQLVNPASELCAAKGGRLMIDRLPSGGEFGICDFGNGRQCEEWSLFRGTCPEGGVDVLALTDPASRYCALTGNEVMGGNKCRVGGLLCDMTDFHQGVCPPKE